MAASYSFAASQIASGGAAKREQKEELVREIVI